MLDQQALAQLKQLKQNIEEQKDRAVGTVKGTSQRFGFVLLDDGREIYLNAEAMQRVFPDDRVQVLVVKGSDERPQAELEKLLESPLKEFHGRCVSKGQALFVEPDLPRFNRWLFLAPHARNGVRDGDQVRCAILRHPFQDGRPQAKVMQVIGSADTAGVETDYMISKFGLAAPWPKRWQDDVIEADDSGREDLTALPLVTIDAEETLDMDDALCAEANADGWQLTVAIADPSALIKPGSALEAAARARATSVYLPGCTVPMLPDELTHTRGALVAGERRPALVCQMQIAANGVIASYRIAEAWVCVQRKLSYDDSGAALLEQRADATLQTLAAVADALRDQRRRDHLLIDDRREYRLVLNEKRHIERIEAVTRNPAHLLVEECMVAANRCAADFLGEQGLFINHPGFRPEKLVGVVKLASEQLALEGVDFGKREGYLTLLRAADAQPLDFPLRAVLARMLERSRLDTAPAPHFGMGLPRYTTFTSPLRKFSDFLVHRMIRSKLRGAHYDTPTTAELEALQAALDRSRYCRNQLEDWLTGLYLQRFLKQEASGSIVQVNSNGFTVRLDDNGIAGFVEARSVGKMSFDPLRLRHQGEAGCYQLEMPLRVRISEVDPLRRNIRFQVVAPAAAEAASA